MKWISFLAIAASLPLSVFASPMPHIDRYVEGKMRDHLVPGLSLVVIRNGVVTHRRGFGELTPADPIVIGSLSKAITATAVLQLAESG